jgi:uncharacterized lipoprotein YehR (DUF1307 family)
MPLNQKKTEKYEKALATVEMWDELKKAIPRYKQMLSSTLYVAMAGCGYKWYAAHRMWLKAKEKNLDPALNGTNIKARTSARRDKVLMRIITHKAVKDVVISEITELIEALNYSIESVSGGYENADGEYVRVYINMRRIEANRNQS